MKLFEYLLWCSSCFRVSELLYASYMVLMYVTTTTHRVIGWAGI